jgi:glycosyltransferase involved in cell wall biosynthesis
MADNEVFGAKISTELRHSGLLVSRPVVFAYSYAARRILETAREFGCMTILGQIDPGPVEDALVAEVTRTHGLDQTRGRPPASYWENWRQECELADRIVVNSAWSRAALVDSGVAPEKIRIIPLAYQAPPDSGAGPRNYPAAFTERRPLRLLFLGQVNVRKGVVELLQAMERLADAPVRLTLVGRAAPGLRERAGGLQNIDWIGSAPRGAVADYYRAADAFILPTHSDGFALTQLEAVSYGLPLIASTHCGEVIKDGVNGILIESVDAVAIEAAIRRALEPGVLGGLSARARDGLADFSPESVVDRLVALAEE